MKYQSIIYISNEIRFVMNTSRQVNLAAQNASLAARRAGNVLGFQAVSSELKTFSQGLTDSMSGMETDILAIAQGVSGIYRQQRMYCHQQAAKDNCEDNEVLINSLSHAEHRQNKLRNTFDEQLRLLQRRLVRSQQLCNNGRALARSALIEASTGGEAECILKNVAHDIERTIEDIYARLKNVGNCLQNEQRVV